jgi:hypothetical protein
MEEGKHAWTPDELGDWLSEFAGLPPGIAWARPRAPTRLGALLSTEASLDGARVLVYAFRFRQAD